ncbi:hypothetical protein [Bradyrhizobium iriomotense]|uniref:hypothetical protein n=1 Tax=Bradyrhizobium iriomotense TaxID=441950 RepID=UPI001FE60F5D|nr:hypothetical protein [Bradyrhizobium iriomotense]
MLDRAWLTSLVKFLLTGIIFAAAFWLIARFSGSLLGSMHFRDEATLVLLAVGGTIVYALAISRCSDASGWSRWCAARRTRRSPPGCNQYPHIS